MSSAEFCCVEHRAVYLGGDTVRDVNHRLPLELNASTVRQQPHTVPAAVIDCGLVLIAYGLFLAAAASSLPIG